MSWYYIAKVVLTVVLIIAISEAAKRSSLLGAILASVPLVSVLGMIWLYHETKDVARIATLAKSIFWLVLPSLVLFVSLTLLLRKQLEFYSSLSISIAVTVACYFLMIYSLAKFGIKL